MFVIIILLNLIEHAGSVCQGVKLRHPEFYHKVQLSDRPVLSLSSRFHQRQGQTFFRKNHRIRADSSD